MVTSQEGEKAKIKEEIWKRLPAHYKIMKKFLEEYSEQECNANGKQEKS